MAAGLHSDYALVPTADDLSATDAETERIVAIARAVELLALVILRSGEYSQPV